MRDRHRCVSAFADLPDDAVVHLDASLAVVDKPAGVVSQSIEAGGDDDIVSRLRRVIAARENVPFERVPLGVHQRLDQATSGVIAYARDKAANVALAKQFEGRTADKRYVAVVVGYRGEKKTTLRHRLTQGRDGTIELADARDRRAQEALTEVEVLERNGDRALLSLRLLTGRTHQARVQLAAVGAPIAGDRIYAGRDPALSAPRLMLHAVSLGIQHPNGRAMTFSHGPPPAFARHLSHGPRSPLAPFDRAAFDEALAHAREQRFGLGRSSLLPEGDARRTTAFRLVNESGDGLPGLAVDVYGDHLLLHVYDDEAEEQLENVLEALEPLGFEGIYVVRRPKQANVVVDSHRADIAPKLPLRGSAAPDEFVVEEHGLPYLVRLGDGLSTGIFLDQRENRRRVRALASGKRVLNLFAYTCPFTLAAAAGGASRTVSVDSSRQALDRGARGLQHAGLDGDRHEFVEEDCFAYLERARRKGERFDLVLLDPPSYSTVGARRFSTASDYPKLAALALSVVANGGALLACTNHRQTVRAKLRRWLHESARAAGRTVTQLKDLPDPADFPAPWGLESHLSSVLCTLG